MCLQGCFGAAFRVSYTSDLDVKDRTCVVKRVDINRKSFKLVMRESWFLRQLHHPNIAHLLHQYVSPNSVPSETDPRDPTIYFIQDDCGQTLLTYLRNRYFHSTIDDLKVVPVETIANILHDLLSACVYLERYGVLHRDIKSDNVLVCGVEPNFTAKMIDFGLAKKFDIGHSNVPTIGPSAMYAEGLGDEREAVAAELSPSKGSAETVTKAKMMPPPNMQSYLFQKPAQYAPEALCKPYLGLVRQYNHDSDLWAVGT